MPWFEQNRLSQFFKKGRSLGVAPKYDIPSLKEINHIQPRDLLALTDHEALENIIYNQEQLDFIHAHAISIRQALAPVVTAFAKDPKDTGIILNFCT